METHHGLQRVPDNTVGSTIEACIKIAQRCLYHMAGVGLYGFDGLNPAVSKKLIEVFILPKRLHSLEMMILIDPDIKLLDNFYRATLTRIQHLPQNTA